MTAWDRRRELLGFFYRDRRGAYTSDKRNDVKTKTYTQVTSHLDQGNLRRTYSLRLKIILSVVFVSREITLTKYIVKNINIYNT